MEYFDGWGLGFLHGKAGRPRSQSGGLYLSGYAHGESMRKQKPPKHNWFGKLSNLWKGNKMILDNGLDKVVPPAEEVSVEITAKDEVKSDVPEASVPEPVKPKLPNTFSPTYNPSIRWNAIQSETLQQSHMTKLNRFPKIFESAKILKPDAKRILSFGCSSGEEAFSLVEYFPNAEIVGVDIDYNSIQVARRNNKFPDRVFFHTDLGATGKYDLVLALMVFFCLDKPVAEEPFRKALKKLNSYINSDGVLMVYTSDHDPGTVPEIAENFSPVNVWKHKHNKNDKEYFNGYYRKKGSGINTSCPLLDYQEIKDGAES